MALPEHVWAAGNGLFGEGTAPADAWVAARKEELWDGDVTAVVAALQTAAAQESRGRAAAEEVHYFTTNAGRMAYAVYRAAGYPLGSGMVESGCKQVVGQRAKGAGMRWSAGGVQGGADAARQPAEWRLGGAVGDAAAADVGWPARDRPGGGRRAQPGTGRGRPRRASPRHSASCLNPDLHPPPGSCLPKSRAGCYNRWRGLRGCRLFCRWRAGGLFIFWNEKEGGQDVWTLQMGHD